MVAHWGKWGEGSMNLEIQNSFLQGLSRILGTNRPMALKGVKRKKKRN